MLRTMSALAILLMLVACVKKVDGNLQVSENVTLNGKDGYVNLAQGTYTAQLQMKKSKKVTMVIRANEKEKVVFNIPGNVSIPRNGGAMRVASAQLGQPYDIEAKTVSVTNTSEPRTSTESCSRQILREVCHYEPGQVRTECHVDRFGRQICREVRLPPRRICQMVSQTVYGVRNVTYRYRGTTTEFLFALMNPESQSTVATFRGSEYDADREILNWGPCHIGGIFYP